MPTFTNHTPTDPDLVDRIFEYLLAEFPQIAGHDLSKAKRAVREEFQGEEVYISGRGPAERHALAMSVLAMFNGRNASEVARRLGIGRATVYRIIKQSTQQKSRLDFPGNETGSAVRSATSTAALSTRPWPSPHQISQPSTLPSPAENLPSSTTDGQ